MSAPDALSELEGLEREATPGPWRTGYGHPPDVITDVWLLDVLATGEPATAPGGKQVWANAALIAALRNAAPQLLAVARAAQEMPKCTEQGPGSLWCTEMTTTDDEPPCDFCKLRAALSPLLSTKPS